MSAWARATTTAALFLSLLVAGCALPPKGVNARVDDTSIWRGRLAIRVDTLQPQSFSAGFELTGSALVGAMTLFNPLGGTVAVLTWDASTAKMRINGDTQHFESLGDLIKGAVGTEIPVGALFAWLAGDLATADGWHPDLSQHANGRITAKRLNPVPPVEIRVVLDN